MLARPLRPRRLGVGTLATLALTTAASLAVPLGLTGPAHAATTAGGPGTVYVADYEAGTIVAVAPDGTHSTFADGFGYPSGVAVDATGNVFVVDNNTGQVDEVASDGTRTTLPFTGLYNPWAVAVDASRDVFVTDLDGAVYELTPDGTQTMLPFSGLIIPSGIDVDAAGDVFVADEGNSAVYELTPGGTQTTVGSGFSSPQGIAVDAAGNVYVADSDTNQVEKVTPGGTQTTVPITGLNYPSDVAIDRAGDLLVTNDDTSKVFQVAPDGTQTTALSGTYSLGLAVSPLPRTTQPIGFTSAPGANPAVGQTYDVSAAGGTSGAPVVFGAGPGSAGVCTVRSHLDNTGVVSLTGPGTCVVTATQAGNRGFVPGQAQQAFGVAIAQAITLTSKPHKPRVGQVFHATATGGSSTNPVVFSGGAKSGNACTVTPTGTVRFHHARPCVVVASQAGDATHYAAPSVFRTIRVRRGVQHVRFTTKAPTHAAAGTTYRAKATGGASGNKVRILVTGQCSADRHGLVTFRHRGACDIYAVQAGNADYLVGRASQVTRVR